MTERVTPGYVRLQDRFQAGVALRAMPTHESILKIARTALRDPALLSEDDIQDLAHTMIVHFAQMGIG